MSNGTNREPMLEMYIFETTQLVDQLEQSILNSEKAIDYELSINEMFRVMHTIKGNSAMMLFNNISELAHLMEDLFDFIRKVKPRNIDYSIITDLVLSGIDFIQNELEKIKAEKNADGDASAHIQEIKQHLQALREANQAEAVDPMTQAHETEKKTKKAIKYYVTSKQNHTQAGQHTYRAVVYFEEGCEMEDIRAFTIVHNLKEIASEIRYIPNDIVENNSSVNTIREEGFKVVFKTGLKPEEAKAYLQKTAFVKDLQFAEEEIREKGFEEIRKGPSKQGKQKKQIYLDDAEKEGIPAAENAETHSDIPTQGESGRGIKEEQAAYAAASPGAGAPSAAAPSGTGTVTTAADMISVSVKKLDALMDLVGELVISEAMVTRNPELSGLNLDSFHKAARQLRKITNELQDSVMSIRMVPLATTFQKMNRLVRDMSKKVGKEVQLELVGQETEVDKNIIEHIGDPLMHLIRNAIDHGIEAGAERVAKGKSGQGKITLEARNAGSDVWIIVKDNGKGLDKERIYKKAYEHGLTKKTESELSDKEIYGFIFLPGFSTKEAVTEFSGRGVGMDVVQKNIEKVRGTIYVDSIPGGGTTISIKIPLTLSIIDGMTVRVGRSRYTIPITDIRESLRIDKEEIIKDLDSNEMIMLRGECHPVTRLHKLHGIETHIKDLHQGIIIILESEGKTLCLFADELLGEQQVVVKTLPQYIKKVKGLAGCTILGDGGISLILDAAGLMGD